MSIGPQYSSIIIKVIVSLLGSYCKHTIVHDNQVDYYRGVIKDKTVLVHNTLTLATSQKTRKIVPTSLERLSQRRLDFEPSYTTPIQLQRLVFATKSKGSNCLLEK